MNDSTKWLAPEPQPILGEQETFDRFLVHGKPGEVFTYATCGTLGDKHVSKETLAVAERAKQAYAKGQVELCQRRRFSNGEPDGFDYLAVKKKHNYTPTVFGEAWKPYITGPGKAKRNRGCSMAG